MVTFQDLDNTVDQIGSLVNAFLVNRNTCPKCGFSWVHAEEVLKTEPLTSRELDETLIIIRNCDVCLIKFSPMIETMRKLYNARRLGKRGIEYGR